MSVAETIVNARARPAASSLLSWRAASVAELVCAATLGLLAVLYIVLDNDSFFNFWTDRDMVRSEMLLREFQWMGAELSYGSAARVPGGFLHYLWVLPTLISKDPVLSYQFCVLLGMLALIPFYLAMRESFGVAAAATATMVLLASPILFGTLTRLWNPSFQVPFIILAFAFMVRLLGARHTASFKWLVVALVLGFQMHLSTFLLLICILVALALTRTRIPLREVAWSIVLTVLLLLPYLIGEMLSGWENLGQMVGSQGKNAVRASSVTKGLLFNPDNVGDVWRWYMLAFGMNDDLPVAPLASGLSWLLNLSVLLGGLYTALSLAYWLEWGKPLARALGIPCGGKHGRVLVGAVVPVLVGFLYFSYSPQVELVIYGSARYLMFAMPGLAIIAGLGAGALMAMGHGHRAAQAALALPVALGLALPAWVLTTSLYALDKPWNQPGRDFLGSLDQIRRQMNWDLAETVAKSSVLRRHDSSDDRWRFENIFGIGYELHRNNIPVPFSAKGECAAYLTEGGKVYGAKGISVGALERSFQQPGLKLEIVRQSKLGNDLLVVYQRKDAAQYCFTTVTNRYVLSDEEKTMLERYGKVGAGKAEPTKATVKDGEQGFILDLGQGISALLKLGMRQGQLALEFHSNQLRGDTYNGGFLDIGMIANPRLVLSNTSGEPIKIVIDPGLVGGKGTFTPLRQRHDIAAGIYDIKFEALVYPPVKLGTWPVDFTNSKNVTVELVKGLAIKP